MSSTLSPGEKAQLEQTIEMFEVIAQSQPQDCQSLEILKEAYSKLGRDTDVIKTSKRIAEAYVQLGQLSSAILEYETILQRHPDDPDVRAALKAIEGKAGSLASASIAPSISISKPTSAATRAKPAPEDDGRASMRKVFVDSKIISAGDFDLCWRSPDPNTAPNGVIESFIQVLADKNILPVEHALKTLIEKTRLAYLPLNKYDIDTETARTFPAEVCRRWCVLPFDCMSKSVLVVTTNPYNKQAAQELAAATKNRLVWYLATPTDIVNNLKKVFR